MAAALQDTGRPWESTPIPCWSLEPRVAPPKVWAKAVSSSEMNVSWEPVQQDMNGILLGYEVSAGRDWERKGAWDQAQGHLAVQQSSSQKLCCPHRAHHMQSLQHRVRSLSSALWLVPVDSLDVTARLAPWTLWEPGGDPEGAWPAMPEPSCPGHAHGGREQYSPLCVPADHPVPEELWPSGF